MYKTLLMTSLMLSGCVSYYNPVPENYSGSTAMIGDSMKNQEKSKAHFFVVKKINDKAIFESGQSTRSYNSGRGREMIPQIEFRSVPTEEMKFTLAGYVHFATDGQALFGNDKYIEGEVIFTPKANYYYQVNGNLEGVNPQLWIEDQDGNRIQEVVRLISN